MIKAAFLATSLDGYIAGKNHDLKWLEIVNQENEDYGYAKFFDSVDAMFMGRNTFDVVSKFETWPYQDRRIFVRTHRELPKTPWDLTPLQGKMEDNLSFIQSQGIKKLYIDGGQLVMDAIKSGQIDDLTISIIPIILGGGIKLFDEIPQSIRVNLKESISFKSGLVQNIYTF